MNDNNSCKDCRAHSGIKTNITHLLGSDKSQWDEINGIKKRSFHTLLGVFLTLVAAIINIGLALYLRGHGG